MNHVVDLCLVTKLEGGVQSLHDTSDDAVFWLENLANAAFVKMKIDG